MGPSSCHRDAHADMPIVPLRIAALVCALPACGHEAWLGMTCPDADMRCDDTALPASSAALDASARTATAANIAEDAATGTAMDGATQPPQPDAHVAAALDAATERSPASCRGVMMSYFACASGDEMPGAPHLQANRAYTIRFRGAYTVDTTFQLQGATAACTALMLETLTVPAGAQTFERCVKPTADVVLLATVVSGDVKVWMNGLIAEICDGCEG